MENEKSPLLVNHGDGDLRTYGSEDASTEVEVRPPGLSENSSGTTWYASIFMVINAALGAGLLEFPYSFSQSGGVVTALTVQAILISFIIGSLFLLAYCSEFRNTTTYPSTIQVICGTKVEIISAICIILYTFGTCVTFLILISDQFTQLFLLITKDDNFCDRWFMSKYFTLTVSSIIIILPLCFSKRIDFLKYASYAGVLAVLYVVFLVMARYIWPINDTSHIHITTKPSSVMDVFVVIPTVCFSYQCHVSIIPIYSCMKNRGLKNFAKAVLTAIALCLFAYSVSATLGYYTFGDDVNQDILRSYKPTTDVMIGVFMIAAKTYTTYPILLFCGRVEVEKLICYIMSYTDEQADRRERLRRFIIASIWFITTLIIALYVPNIAVVINVLGALAALFIFFFPGMCLMKISYDYTPIEQKYRRLFFNISAGCFMVIGAFLFGLVTVQSIYDAINPKSIPLQNTSHCLD